MGIFGLCISPPRLALHVERTCSCSLGRCVPCRSRSPSLQLTRWRLPALLARVQRSLLVLSKVYRCLPKSIFGGIAHEAVGSSTASIQQASRMVARRSGPMDGQLFMIKHLLILREQIAPFEVRPRHASAGMWRAAPWPWQAPCRRLVGRSSVRASQGSSADLLILTPATAQDAIRACSQPHAHACALGAWI